MCGGWKRSQETHLNCGHSELVLKEEERDRFAHTHTTEVVLCHGYNAGHRFIGSDRCCAERWRRLHPPRERFTFKRY